MHMGLYMCACVHSYACIKVKKKDYNGNNGAGDGVSHEIDCVVQVSLKECIYVSE